MKFGLYWLIFGGIILIRYFLVAGGAYLFFYSLEHPFSIKQKAHFPTLSQKSIKHDILMSAWATIALAFCSACIMVSYESGLTRLYTSFTQYGLWYLCLSFVAILFLQDTCFYFIHRLLHHPLLFKHFHSGHHFCADVTPWTSFALDFPEALIQGLFFVVVVFIIPLHFTVLIALLLTMTFWAVLNHIGFELFGLSLFSHWLGKWFVGSTYHSNHHLKYRMHYGLYFTFWDRLMGTYDSDFEN